MTPTVFMICIGSDDHNKSVYAAHIQKFHSRLNFWEAKTAKDAAKVLVQRQSVLMVLTNEQFATERAAISEIVKANRGRITPRAVIFGSVEPPLSENDGFADVVNWRQKYAKVAAE